MILGIYKAYVPIYFGHSKCMAHGVRKSLTFKNINIYVLITQQCLHNKTIIYNDTIMIIKYCALLQGLILCLVSKEEPNPRLREEPLICDILFSCLFVVSCGYIIQYFIVEGILTIFNLNLYTIIIYNSIIIYDIYLCIQYF